MSLDSLSVDHTLVSLLIRFFVNLFVLIILIRVIYYRYSRKDEFLFSFLILGIIIFLIVSLLETIEVQMGMALGLFAIFAILRFRTKDLTVKEMTYIFTTIGVSVINSQAHIPPPILGAIVINSLIISAVFFLEVYLHGRATSSITVSYSNLDLLAPDRMNELLTDLSLQTRQDVKKVNILEIDIRKGSADLEVFYKKNLT
jgi:phosphoglycerol transferase MdoB-like AlkP superfamily enzyme